MEKNLDEQEIKILIAISSTIPYAPDEVKHIYEQTNSFDDTIKIFKLNSEYNLGIINLLCEWRRWNDKEK